MQDNDVDRIEELARQIAPTMSHGLGEARLRAYLEARFGTSDPQASGRLFLYSTDAGLVVEATYEALDLLGRLASNIAITKLDRCIWDNVPVALPRPEVYLYLDDIGGVLTVVMKRS